MKKWPLFLFAVLSLLTLNAQDDDCSCMDDYPIDQSVLDEINDWSKNMELIILVAGNASNDLTLDQGNSIPINQKPIRLNTSPKQEKEKPESIKVEKQQAEIVTTKEEKILRVKGKTTQRKSNIKKSKKMFSKRVKRKTKAKKYKGKCPHF